MILRWRRPRIGRGAGPLLLCAVLVAGGAGATSAQVTGGAQAPVEVGTRAPRPASSCQLCHGELEFLRQHASSLERAEELNISDRALRGSGHDFPCTRCHAGFGTFPHATAATETRTCASCHADVTARWQAGAHAQVERGKPVGCSDCHDVHTVPTRSGFRAASAVQTMNRRCLECHETRRLPAGGPHASDVPCAACHGAHDIRAHDQAGSRLSPADQGKTCGACHQEVAASWSRDAHGRAVLTGDVAREVSGGAVERPPTCTTCHGGHALVRPEEAAADSGPGAACIGCHAKYGDTFADSYHGQATRLGSRRAAGCAGCHTAHNILPADSARSSVSSANLVTTCRQCHKEATASFVAFQPHADVHDRAKSPLSYWTYKFMTFLLAGTMIVFGVHTVLWLARLGIGRIVEARKAARAAGSHGGDA
jgi:RNase P subunit RPR2